VCFAVVTYSAKALYLARHFSMLVACFFGVDKNLSVSTMYCNGQSLHRML